jgi:hypothetical protein
MCETCVNYRYSLPCQFGLEGLVRNTSHSLPTPFIKGMFNLRPTDSDVPKGISFESEDRH